MAAKKEKKSTKKSKPVASRLQKEAAKCNCATVADAVRQRPDFEPERPKWIMQGGKLVWLDAIHAIDEVDAESCDIYMTTGDLLTVAIPFPVLAELLVGDDLVGQFQDEVE